MKKLLLLVSCLLTAGVVQAQFGVRAGANYATQSTKSDPYNRADVDGQVGFQGGVFYEKKLAGRFSVVPEVQLSYQRSQLQVASFGIADGGYDARYRLALTYLNVPVLLRAAFGQRFYLELGPQAGVLQQARESGSEYFDTLAGRIERSFERRATTDSYRRFDVGLVAGAGLKLGAGFGLGLRASSGLLSLTRPFSNSNYQGKLRNQVVQAAVSYQFGG